ncbi:hypothetical protein RDWZM_005301 [Blomia tropicalis]|uniref:Angiogenic factor with G patch and FHA domains 1 n=1 Tax=Blomia tropicalis TaxID=40697 RepID=A0A9Q0RM73_BLOTA|nr:hypothetical protein RDWZM_005301 [Blomia tropicalis]
MMGENVQKQTSLPPLSVNSTDKSNEQRHIERIEKENRSLVAYNEELCDQIKLMNAKLQLAKNFLYQSVSTQTDVHIPISDINSHVFTNCIMIPDNDFKCDTNEQSNQNLKSDLDQLLNEMKASGDSDYRYDPKSKTYYSISTGWFYYPEQSAFYNPQNRSFYRYDVETKQYGFMYALDEQGNRKGEKKEPTTDTTNPSEEIIISDDSEEEGEIIEFDNNNEGDEKQTKEHSFTEPKRNRPHISSNSKSISMISPTIIESKPFLRRDHIDSETSPKDKEYLNDDFIQVRKESQIPPVRLIILSAEQLDVGSLILVNCLGGKIGQHARCAVTIPDLTVSQLHAEISYDRNRGCYMLQDLCSRNGTYQNEKKLEPLERNPLFHGDILAFSDSVRMLAHIHQHRDFTCSECIPGRIENDGYKKKEIGSDNPYEKTAAGSGLDMPLDERNKGFQMMEKMGWKTGQGLGTSSCLESTNTDPIEIEMRDTRHGLGFK